MRPWQRFTAVEFSKPAALPEEIARKTGIPIKQAHELLLGAGDRVRGILGLESVPIAWTADRVQFQNFSGLLVLAPGLELEVAPKFLGNVPGWREDFFLLATLSHHGRLLDSEGLRSSSQATSDLATLIGRSLIEMYWRNQRRPLRSYRRLHQNDFAIEGDFDPEDLISPSDEGYPQEVTSFTRANPYNAVIGTAAAQLAPVVPDAETRARLERVAQHLPRQAVPLRLKDKRLPSRSRAWQPTYDLSLDILRGLGGTYDPSNALAPGFVVQTWQAWEHLISFALRSAFGAKNVSLQSRHVLGTRETGGVQSMLNVFPDGVLSIQSPSGERKVLVDAKYKGNIERAALSVSNADIYEALAFSRATGIKEIVLLYPRRIDGPVSTSEEAGSAKGFSSVNIDDVVIGAVELGVCGISKKRGLNKFVEAVSSVI